MRLSPLASCRRSCEFASAAHDWGVSEMDVAGTLAIGGTVAVIVSGLVPFFEAYDASHFPREPGRAGR